MARTIIGDAPPSHDRRARATARCERGGIRTVTLKNIRRGQSTQCKKCRNGKAGYEPGNVRRAAPVPRANNRRRRRRLRQPHRQALADANANKE